MYRTAVEENTGCIQYTSDRIGRASLLLGILSSWIEFHASDDSLLCCGGMLSRDLNNLSSTNRDTRSTLRAPRSTSCLFAYPKTALSEMIVSNPYSPHSGREQSVFLA